MDLDQLRAFVTVSEELHFGRAALRLGCSQPQVSRRVRGLEDELGLQLFVRTARRTALTDAGVRLLEDARDTLAAAERLQRRAAAAGEVPPAAWSSGSCGARSAPTWRRWSPPPPSDTPRSVLAIPADHPLARAEKLVLAQLDELPMVALERDLAPSAYDAVTAAAADREVRLRIVQQTRSPSEALALVSAGIGVYRLPSSAALPHHGIVYREIEDAPSRLVLIRRPEPPAPAVAAIAALASEVFSDADDASNDGAGGLELSAAAI